MAASPSSCLDALRADIRAIERGGPAAPARPVQPFGIEAVDSRLAGGGLLPALHEAAAAGPAPGDDAAATLFLAALAARFSRSAGTGQVLWAVARRDLFAPGLAQAGLTPDRLLFAWCGDEAETLAVMEEGVRHGSLAAVIGEAGRAEMTATRRLQLAAEGSGTPAFLLRRWRKQNADPLAAPSAACTRWRIGCAPSSPLPLGIHRRRDSAGRAGGSRSSASAAARLSNGFWRPPMPRLASLFLPQLAIERIAGRERRGGRREAVAPSPLFPVEQDQPPSPRQEGKGVRPGHWRPGARWAREAAVRTRALRIATGALVTWERSGNRDLIAAACPEARALGIAPGMTLAKARVLVRGLDVRPADPGGDAAWLARLGLFAARRWTPRAAVSGGDGLWLDLTGVAHLFGGEEAMCRRVLAFCRRLGFTARIAVAGSLGAAHALARFGGRPLLLCPAGGEADLLAPMPLAALRLDGELLSAAHRLGLERIGELVAMPRAPLQRRFGETLLRRLDQALGRAAEPFEAIVPEEAPAILLRFLEPIATAEAIAEASGEAVRRLVPLLAGAGLGVRRLVLLCERIDNAVQPVSVSLARATRDGAHLHKLLVARIETIEPGFGIERLRLVAARVEPLGALPIEGELAGARPAPDLATLVDRLAARLGARRVHRLGAVESDLPERSVRALGPLDAPQGWPRWPRPVRLLSPPEPVDHVMAPLPDGPPRRFVWRGRRYEVAAADGPERLYGEWWRHAREQAAIRDYFQVEDESGARFWLFRKGDGEDPATGDLSWHMHGLFA